MVLALAGDSTTTTSVIASLAELLRPVQSGVKATRDSREGSPRGRRVPVPASAAITAAGDNWQRTDQIVNRRRRRAEQVKRLAAGAAGMSAGVSAAPSGSERLGHVGARRRGRTGARVPAPPASGWSGRLSEHVGERLGQVRALPDQVVRAAAARVERRAGHREQLPPVLLRQPRGDQAARARRRLDHDHAERQPGDDPVAAREVPGLRRGAERRLGDAPPRPRPRSGLQRRVLGG